jgi:hypothetical protein
MREPTKTEKAVTEAYRRHAVRGALSGKVLSTDEVSVASLEKVAKGEKQISVAKLRAVLPNALAADPDAALELVSDLLGLRHLGIVVSLEPLIRATADVQREVLEAVAAAGQVAAGQVAGAPLEEMQASARAAVREAVEAERAIRSLCGAQQSFAEVR